MSKKRIGILTGGGDAPGLNGVIESVVRCLADQNLEIIGIRDGFEGIFKAESLKLEAGQLIGAHALSGTLLGTSNKSSVKGKEAEFLKGYEKLNLEGLVAIGGDGTFHALSLVRDKVKLVGVPKTIDNDLAGTELTFGFDTACAVVADGVDALRFTADAHRRVFVVETMGRDSGWIALGGGLASMADAILIPERKFTKQDLRDFVQKKKQLGTRGLVIVVAEGAAPLGEDPQVAFTVPNSPEKLRYGGIGLSLSRWIEAETGWESRHVVLGHLQRSRAPTTTDRFLTAAMGFRAAELVKANKWGESVVYRLGKVTTAPIEDLMLPPKRVRQDHSWVQIALGLGIYI